jgi:hypothetical protein
MRTFLTIVGLSLLVVYASAAASSSSAVVSSNKTNSTNTTAATTACVQGSDAPCIAINSNWCCYYTWY